MFLKRHYINIWIRIIGILLNCFAIAFVTVVKPDWFFLLNLLILLFIQVFLFVRSQNTINLEIEYLFDSINCSDTTTKFLTKKGNKEFVNIYKKFDEILEQIQKLKVDSLQKSEYLSTLFEHVNIGILSVTGEGKIEMMNSSAKRILVTGNLKDIEGLRLVDNALAHTIEKIKPNESNLVSIYKDGYLQHLTIRAAFLKFINNEIKIVSFQNIRSELDEKEMESWQKLIRVLTHELMNSSGPINSTISTILELLTEDDQIPKNVSELTPEILNDTVKGLKIIEERSRGMLDFVKRFRSLTLIPHPEFEDFLIDNLINDILVLLQDDAEKENIELVNKTLYNNLKVRADKGMIQQILINLIRNSFDALKGVTNSKVNLSSWSDNNNNIYINVIDNGKGVPANIQDKIFVPFYTTRKKGTGIGLSLSRQLANVQGGALVLTKSTEDETIFTLKIKSID